MQYFVTNKAEYQNRVFRDKILNVENTPHCSNACSVCKRTEFKNFHGPNAKLPGKDLTPDELKKMIRYFRRINFCGQVSDPIYGKHFVELLKICHDTETACQVMTAASGRPRSWWVQAFEANPAARWIFGIDGPPHLSHLYRVNQNGEFLFEMMNLAKSMGLNVLWQLIVFRYNEDKLEECKALAKTNNINLEILISSRGIADELKPTNPAYRVK